MLVLFLEHSSDLSMESTCYPSLVLVQSRKTCPYITERLLIGRKESNRQTNQHARSPV